MTDKTISFLLFSHQYGPYHKEIQMIRTIEKAMGEIYSYINDIISESLCFVVNIDMTFTNEGHSSLAKVKFVVDGIFLDIRLILHWRW